MAQLTVLLVDNHFVWGAKYTLCGEHAGDSEFKENSNPCVNNELANIASIELLVDNLQLFFCLR